MARIIGGIGSSHAPSIGVAYDRGKQDDPAWKPLFDGYAPVKQWLLDEKADVLVLFYNDHGVTFFFDRYPTFALGVGEKFAVADEGWGRRPLPDVKGDAELGWHIARSLIEQEFDITVCQEMPLDHGAMSPLPLLWPHEPDWPGAVIPIAVNVLQHPIPTARRLWRLGQALRRAIHAYPEDLRIVMVGTGGLSHQLHGERFGHANPAWDNEFLDLIERDPEALAALPHETWMRRGGAESVEMIMWLGMRGALSPRVRRLHRNYYQPMLTGLATVLFEDTERSPAPIASS